MVPEVGELNKSNAVGEELCRFTIFNITSPTNSNIGEDFIRAAYIVVDIYDQEISMVQALYDVDDSNIAPFSARGAGAPSAITLTSQPANTRTDMATETIFPAFTPKTYVAAAGYTSLANTASISTAAIATLTVTPTEPSTVAWAGIGVGAPVSSLAVLGAILFLVWRRERQQHPIYTPEAPSPAQPVPEAPDDTKYH
ncbi:uncharacterized protein BCR38DRAFT_412111 [Pseudomassariella vexata]|uniref:Uncharacterized protein n=1 Tax=Pseudomassariella vexata TaxID=1141098 RepID=A0A1Y2DQU4_9PEZI|nr:uncharacterized protein BCR38DRAFT_412111 [Pseudomassariella vexata]ORY61015.1 hypothetical protein BCR38DRAFT_412111 [Pseudomassariella vexata]